MSKTRRYSDRFIRRVKRQLDRGLNWTDIMKKYNIPFGSMTYLIRLVKDSDINFEASKSLRPIIKIYIKKVIIKK